MITFSCSCGKKYQLPDRNGGREVRCNQCGERLLVPKQSQTEPVLPVGKAESQPQADQAVATDSITESSTPEKAIGAEKAAEALQAETSAPMKVTVPPMAEEELSLDNPFVSETKSSASENAGGMSNPESTTDSKVQPMQSAQVVQAELQQEQGKKSGLGSILVFVLAVLLAFAGGFFGKGFLSENKTGDQERALVQKDPAPAASSDENLSAQPSTEIRSKIESAQTALNEALLWPVTEAEQVMAESDETKRQTDFNDLLKRRSDARLAWVFRTGQLQALDLLNTPDTVSQDRIGVVEPVSTIKQWAIPEDRFPVQFVASTWAGEPVLLSLDKNPAEGKEGTQKGAVLDVVAAALLADHLPKDDRPHKRSFRMDSLSPHTLSLRWPAENELDTDASSVSQWQFSFYLSDKANQLHQPTKPDGFDKVIECQTLGLRIHTHWGFLEYLPSDHAKLTSWIEQARRGWCSVSIPVEGNNDWKCTKIGSAPDDGKNLRVRQVEIFARPTGQGLTIWLDNLKAIAP